MGYSEFDIAKAYKAYNNLARATSAESIAQRKTLLRLIKKLTGLRDTAKALAIARLAAGFPTGKGGDLPPFMQARGKSRAPGLGGRPARSVGAMTTNNVGRGRRAR